MPTKLYPPQLEGTLPAFCKNYKNGDLTGAAITIPFGMNRAVSRSAIRGIRLRLRTASTNTFILEDLDGTVNLEEFYAIFELNNKQAAKINESQYYRVQLAFVDSDGTTGYYSTVGIIKCVARPTVTVGTSAEFSNDNINFVMNTLVGVYTQNTQFGDSTEKAYSYQFRVWDSGGNLIIDSGEQIHDITADVSSYSSRDVFETQKELITGEVYTVQYTVTTLNGLKVNSVKYKIMKSLSVDIIYPIQLHAEVDYDNGYIALKLHGPYDYHIEYIYSLVTSNNYDENTTYYVQSAESGIYQIYAVGTLDEWSTKVANGELYVRSEKKVYEEEEAYNGTFVITRASSQDNYFEWETIKRFNLNGELLSNCIFYDKTVQQGITYKYALQQYNKQYVYSNKIYLTYSHEDYLNGICEESQEGQERTIVADFEDMFLFDGKRQLRVRFNPKVSSFKNTIPEQKIETIGSKYPFIFRNGSVCYKEFPIEGLVSFQMDEGQLFLQGNEWEQSGILEYDYRRKTDSDGIFIANIDNQSVTGHETTYIKKSYPVYDKDTGVKTGTVERLERVPLTTDGNAYIISRKYDTDEKLSTKPNIIRGNRDLTSENIMSERYFKLKVLDWLTDGKVKLFRSPTEGNYLVRLLNVSLSPEDALGRMIHTFTCMAYEIAELTYENLLAYGIITEDIVNLYESHWCSCDTNNIMNNTEPDSEGFYPINLNGNVLTGLEISDFAPGDILKIHYVGDSDGDYDYFTVGVTGTLNFNNENRPISEVYVKPNEDTLPYNDFSRSIIYSYTGMQLTEFDMVSNVLMQSQVADQFIGPKDNLLDIFTLRYNAYGVPNESGITTDVIDPQDGKDAIFQSLVDRELISYEIRPNAPKVTLTKIDMLQAHRRELIPIFYYGELDADGTLDTLNEEDLKFALTPFGRGYVNGDNILDYLNEDLIFRYNTTAILQVLPYEYYGGVNVNDIYDAFKSMTGSIIDHLSIYRVFVYNESANQWQPLDSGHKYRYYDNYTHSWWDNDEEYDPSISINDQDNGLDVNTNNIYLHSDVVTYYNLGTPEKVRIGNGAYVELIYRLRIVDYEIEDQTNAYFDYYAYEGLDQDTDELTISPKTVKEIREIYLKTKQQFQDDLNNYNVNSIDILQKQNDYKDAYTKLYGENGDGGIQKQIDEHQQNMTSEIKQAQDVAEAHIINLKRKILDAQKIIEAFAELLQSIKAPAVIEDLNRSGLTTSIPNLWNDANANTVGNFTEPAEGSTEESTYISDSTFRELHLQNVVNEIIKDGQDLVNVFRYVPSEEVVNNIIEEQQDLIRQYEDQIKTIRRAMGKQVGAYDDYIDDETLQADITLADLQADYDAIQAQIDELNAKHQKDMESYGAIFDFIATLESNKTNYTSYTDDYLIKSATAIKDALTSYIENLKNQRDSLIQARTIDLNAKTDGTYGSTAYPIKYVPSNTHYARDGVTYYVKSGETYTPAEGLNSDTSLEDQYEKVTSYDSTIRVYYKPSYIVDTTEVNETNFKNYYTYDGEANVFEKVADDATFSANTRYYRLVYLATTDNITESTDFNSNEYYKKKVYYVQATFKEAYPELYDSINYNYAEVFTSLDEAIELYEQRLITITVIADLIKPNNINFLRKYSNSYSVPELKPELSNKEDLLYLNKLHELQKYFKDEDWLVKNVIYYVIDQYNAIYVQDVLYFLGKYMNTFYEFKLVEDTTDIPVEELYYLDENGFYKQAEQINSRTTYYILSKIVEDTATVQNNTSQEETTNSTDEETPQVDYSKVQLLISYIKAYNAKQALIVSASPAVPSLNYEINIDNDSQVIAIRAEYDAAVNSLQDDKNELAEQEARMLELQDASGLVPSGTPEHNSITSAIRAVENRINKLKAEILTIESTLPSLKKRKEDIENEASRKIENEVPIIDTLSTSSIQILVKQAREYQVLINDIWSSLTDDEKKAALRYLNSGQSSVIGSYENTLSILLQQLSDSETRLNKMRNVLAAYQEEIDRLNDEIVKCEGIIDEQKEARESETAKYGESSSVFEDIVSGSQIKNILNVLRAYIGWLKKLSEAINTEIGTKDPNIKTGLDRIHYFRTVIEMYEDEAFELLHYYDALPEDLNEGFGGIAEEGLDYQFNDLSKINLYAYKDILYLGQDREDFTTEQKNALESRRIGNPLYKVLYKNIRENLIMPANAPGKDLGVIYTIETNSQTGEKEYKFYMVEIGEDYSTTESYEKFNPSYKKLNSNETLPSQYYWLYTDPFAEGYIEISSLPVEDIIETEPLEGHTYWIETTDPNTSEKSYSKQDNLESFSSGVKYVRWSKYNPNLTYYTYNSEAKEYNEISISEETWVETIRNNKIYVLMNNSNIVKQTFIPQTIFYNNTNPTDITYTSALNVNDDNIINNSTNTQHNIEIAPQAYEDAASWRKDLTGSIIHEYNDAGREINSLNALQALEIEQRYSLIQYLIVYAIKTQKLSKFSETYKLCKADEERQRYNTEQKNHYNSIANACDTVYKARQAQYGDDTKEQRQLKQLIQTARAQEQYYDSIAQAIQKEIDSNVEYQAYKNANTEVEKFVNAYTTFQSNLLENYSNCKTNYENKVKHYLSLIFDNINDEEGYSNTINKNVIQLEDFPNKYNPLYGFSLNENNYVSSIIHAIDEIREYENKQNISFDLSAAKKAADDFISYCDDGTTVLEKIKELLKNPEQYQYIEGIIPLLEFTADIPEDYDENLYFYLNNQNEYQLYIDNTVEEITPYIIDDSATQQKLQGLLGILNAIYSDNNSNDYVDKLRDEYEATYGLYVQLEQQRLSNRDEALIALLAQKADLEETINSLEPYAKIVIPKVDEEDRLLKIKYALTDYFYYLTCAYVEQVEKRFGVV